MKKILITLFALLILVGCSATKGYSKISEGSEVLFKGPDDYSYTKEDLYEYMKVASADAIENDLLKRIATSLNVSFEELEEEADKTVEMYKEMGYESAILNAYGSVDAFKEIIMNSEVMTKLSEIYINDKFDELIENDKPIKMQLASFPDKETADKFKKDIEDGHTFEEAAATNGYDTECSVAIYMDTDNIPLSVKSYINETADTGLSSVIVDTVPGADQDGNDTTTSTYYVLNIVSRNVEEFKDEYKDAKIEKLGEDGVKEYMFSTHDIKFFDQDIYEIMKAKYEVLQ